MWKVLYCLCFMLCLNYAKILQIKQSVVKQWALDFKMELDSDIEKTLSFTKVKDMLRKYESFLNNVPINGRATFTDIYTNVNLKYNDLVLAANKLKSEVEKIVKNVQAFDEPDIKAPVNLDDITSFKASAEASVYIDEVELGYGSVTKGNQDDSVTGVPPPLGPRGPQGPSVTGAGVGSPPLGPSKSLTRCCVRDPSRQYTGRYREDVNMGECYENIDDTLRKISKSNLENVFKENLVKSAVMWQYFADSAGHYIQYPNSDRMCDQASPNHTSPLLQEWFVEKLYMERKNLVILVDNGPLTAITSSGSPVTDRHLLIDALKQTLKTLTPNDKVTIVTLQSSIGGTRIVPACTDQLFIATPSNLDLLSTYVSKLPYGTGKPDLREALKKVFQLYQAEKTSNEAGYKSRTNLVLMLISHHSQLSEGEGTLLYEMIATQQKLLDESVQHFVYVVGKPNNASTIDLLAKIADQNNIKLRTTLSPTDLQWPPIPNLVHFGKPVGKEGVLEIVEKREEFPIQAATYFNRLPPQLDDRQTSLIVPVLDKTAGLLVSVAATVYGEDRDIPVGVVAVDASLADVFSDLINVNVGHKSYGFLVDNTHGHVLLHPKLRDGSDGFHSKMLFPRLQLLEPDFLQEQINAIIRANETLASFNASVSLGRPLVTGELVKTGSNKKEPVTVYYQLGYGTCLCVVFVHFLSDEVDSSLQRVPQGDPLHAPYHRIDELLPSPASNKPKADDVCNLHGTFLSYKESVIKLSPWVFNKPVEYKYSQESFEQISQLNSFLINQTPTNLIREDQKLLIQHFVLATDDLDVLWKYGDKDVIERFLGSGSGMFRLYPGSPMDNTFDHMQTDWYKRSVAFPGVTMYHRGKLSFTNHNDVVIVSKALVEAGRLQGVIGMTTTRRALTSKLIKSVPDCYGGDQQCHVIEATGNILDSLLPGDDLHLSKTYPWLTRKLTQRGSLMVDWCTGYSDGYHKETFTLTGTLTSDLSMLDPCRHYSLQSVTGTNLFILILANRTKNACDDHRYELCRSCQTSGPTDQYHLSLPQCQLCLSNLTTQCQCQCYCDTDVDLCEGQFKVNTPNFPRDACFYPMQMSLRPELQPSSPGPDSGLEFCPIPCAAIEDMGVCVQLEHCKLTPGLLYPSCVWKSEDELQHSNVSWFFPTSPIPEPPTPPHLTTKTTVTLVSSKSMPPVISYGTSSPLLPSTTDQLGTSKATLASSSARPSSKQPTTQTAEELTSGRISSPEVSGLPTFVHPVMGSSLAPPLTTGSQLHSVTGEPTLVPRGPSSIATPLAAHNEPDDEDLSGGAIAAIILSILLILAILAFIAMKLYGKKFCRPGAETSSRYRTRSSLFDSTIFNRATNEVTTGVVPQSTVPYDNLQRP